MSNWRQKETAADLDMNEDCEMPGSSCTLAANHFGSCSSLSVALLFCRMTTFCRMFPESNTQQSV